MSAFEPVPIHLPQRAPIAKELISLSWPIALSMLSYSVMTAVDTLFVGRFGAEAISAVGLGGLATFTLLTFGMGLLRGGKIIVARTVGANRGHEVPRLAAATVALSLIIAIVTWVVTISVAPLLGHVFLEASANEFTVTYVMVRSLALPLMLVATALRELSQGVGDSKRPMWAAVTANLLNIPLNALLVLHLGWGVAGSAWANVFAQFVDLAMLAWQRRDWLIELRRVSWKLLRQVAERGWPLGLELFLDVSAFTMLGFILARLGATEMASHQIGLQISHLSTLPILAIGEASSVLVGQAAGAKQLHRVPRIHRAAIGTALVLSSTTGLLLIAFPRAIVSAFTPDPVVQRLTAILLLVVAGQQMAFSFYASGKCVLRALGDIRFTATITVAAAWLCSPPLAFLFGHVLGWGVVGGWCALAVEITAASLIYLARFESGRWRRHLNRLELFEYTAPASMPMKDTTLEPLAVNSVQ
ncbi:MAG TPA: MATE family efflux transporter [Polyangiaceae bacterium]